MGGKSEINLLHTTFWGLTGSTVKATFIYYSIKGQNSKAQINRFRHSVPIQGTSSDIDMCDYPVIQSFGSVKAAHWSCKY